MASLEKTLYTVTIRNNNLKLYLLKSVELCAIKCNDPTFKHHKDAFQGFLATITILHSQVLLFIATLLSVHSSNPETEKFH